MEKNFIYGIAAIYLNDMGTKIGYIEKGSWDWGGQSPEVTDVDAEQVPDAPVVTLVNSNPQNNPTFNLIQLDYENIHRFLGGRLIANGWEAPSDMVRLHGRFYIEFASGQVMVIPDAAIYASMGGKLTLTEVSKIECQLEIHTPDTGEKKFKINSSGWPCLLMQRLWDNTKSSHGNLDATLYKDVYSSRGSHPKGSSISGDGLLEYFTRCVKHNGRYYVVEKDLPGQYNPYSARFLYWGSQTEIHYAYAPDIIYYSESENMFLDGSFRGEELVPERASGGEWHRLMTGSRLETGTFMRMPAAGIFELRIKIGGRNMGSSAASLVLRLQGLRDATESTLTWQPSEQSEVDSGEIQIYGSPGSAISLAVCNESGVTSNVCIDYVIIERI